LGPSYKIIHVMGRHHKCVEFNDPLAHIIGPFGDDFYGPDDQTNSVKALKETTWSLKIRLEFHQNHSTMLQ